MNSFYIAEEPYHKGRYYIAVKIVIYREKLGKYPDFLSGYNIKSTDGYSTKFAYLLAENLDFNIAEIICSALETKYAAILRDCENSGNWNNCPFDFSRLEILWSK